MYEKHIKRYIDVTLSALALIALSPLLMITCVLIKIDSRGPVIFKQRRFGRDKRIFMIYKFRTMDHKAPGNVPTDKMADARSYITRVGKILRKTSIDELPQLVNILKGDMSLVGPRPALWNQYELIRLRDAYGANRALPGLTGLAQVNGRDELDEDVKARYDGNYANHISFGMDVRCMAKTFISVIKCEGVVDKDAHSADAK